MQCTECSSHKKTELLTTGEAKAIVEALPTMLDELMPDLQVVKETSGKVALAGGAATVGLGLATASSSVKGKYKWLTGAGAVASGLVAGVAGATHYLLGHTQTMFRDQSKCFLDAMKLDPKLEQGLIEHIQKTVPVKSGFNPYDKGNATPEQVEHASAIISAFYDYGKQKGHFDPNGYMNKTWKCKASGDGVVLPSAGR